MNLKLLDEKIDKFTIESGSKPTIIMGQENYLDFISTTMWNPNFSRVSSDAGFKRYRGYKCVYITVVMI